MKRRQFLQTSAAVFAALGTPAALQAQSFPQPDVIRIGHLVGICMSPLFCGHATGMF